MKILTVVGARPQFVKASALSRALSEHGAEEVLVHTGQHYDDKMSAIFFDELNIPRPQYNLGIGSMGHGAQTGRMLERLEEVFKEQNPEWVVVYGDTNSTLAGALAAVKLHLPVAHVESGLRSFNKGMPEEINRVVSDHVADVLFAPTLAAVDNLRSEGIPPEKIDLVGDVMYDVALFYKDHTREQLLEELRLETRQYVLATVHRAENTDNPAAMQAIFDGLASIAEELPVVVPLHPRTEAALQRQGLMPRAMRTLRLIKPVGYLDMMTLEKNAKLVATDSGGVQKEAYFCNVPCVTLRQETEWVELVNIGCNHLVAPQTSTKVSEAIKACLERSQPVTASTELYGGGEASRRIARRLITKHSASRASDSAMKAD